MSTDDTLNDIIDSIKNITITPKLKIIGASTCSHCSEAKEYCIENDISFDFIDLLKEGNESYIKDVINDDKLEVPKICREDTGICIVGFDKDKIKKLVED